MTVHAGQMPEPEREGSPWFRGGGRAGLWSGGSPRRDPGGVDRRPTVHDRLRMARARLRGAYRDVQGARRELIATGQLIEMLHREIADLERGLVLPAPIEQAWSPRPVLGYRAWRIHRGGLRGVREQWREPEFRAVCAGRPLAEQGDIPHHDGLCGRLGCGIYAVKDPAVVAGGPRPWLRLFDGTVFGLVALTGKVVEHERGYRAARARVVAAAMVGLGRLTCSADPAWIRAVFAEPARAHGDARDLPGDPSQHRVLDGHNDDEMVRREIADYLRYEARRFEQTWT